MNDVLFEIKKEHLETGLRGFPVGYCTTSVVDPEKGLHYAGMPAEQLAFEEPEKVIYLLYRGRFPTPQELEAFREDLRARSFLSKPLVEQIRKLPRDGHPMKLFAISLLLLGMLEGKSDYEDAALDVIAKSPLLAAEVINHSAGWGATPPSKPELGYMENFTHLLNLPDGKKEELAPIFRVFNVLHYDHGGGNLSTFVGKAIASSLEDMYGSLAGAMCALAGPRHGRANQDCLDFVKGLYNDLNGNINAGNVEKALREKLQRGDLIFGFGHAVLRVEDTRATVFYNMAEKQYPSHPLVQLALLLRKQGPKVLKENPKISSPYPNVDAISGILLTAAGFPYEQYYTVLFGAARSVGISLQIIYERKEARGGKGTPIVRPKYIFQPKK